MKRLATTLLLSLALVTLPEAAYADRQIRIIYRSDEVHRDRDYYRDHPVIRPRHGRNLHRREVIILSPLQIGPFPGGQPSPLLAPPPVVSAQTESPRLLHGQEIYPVYALVYGRNQLAGREGPGTVYSVLTRFVPGQWVTLTQVAGGADGYDWYLAASPSGQYAWVRGDAVAIYVDED
ncbi:MAG: SH3 domain-containing protein [Synechococcales bacterium]|nr:SH3 domain-containing protein [Synechococcales bacterium]